MARLTLSSNLTRGYSKTLDQQIRATHQGQAYFANTGPFGATCHECIFWGYFQQHRDKAGNSTRTTFRKSCAKYHVLTGRHGAIVPANASACRYFERKKGEDNGQ
jgi:hypothetical protein